MSADLSIEDQHKFSTELLERLDSNGVAPLTPKTKPTPATEPPVLKRILDLARKLFSMEGLDEHHCLSPGDLESIEAARDLVKKVQGVIDFAMRSQGSFLASLCKFSYLTQRIFLYLIYQGFCGQDD